MPDDTVVYFLTDETLVAQAFGMRRQQSTPVPISDRPLLGCAWAYGSVLRDPATGLFRMWYLGARGYIEYFATSEDGLGWDLPDLGILPPDEQGRTNAFMGKGQTDQNGLWLGGDSGPEGFCVLDAEQEPHPAAKERFTAMYLAGTEDGPSGLCVAYSDDGVHWTACESNPVVQGWLDTSNSLVWDPDTRRYAVYGRPPVHLSLRGNANRFVSVMESDNMIHWSAPRTVLDTDDRDADPWDQVDEGLLANKERVSVRGRNRQFYGMSVFRSAGMFIGMAQILDVPTGACWIELVHSHDGLDWRREPGREPFIVSRPGTWEHPQLRPTVTSPPVRVGDDLWIYYSASNVPHHGKGGIETRGIGCRTLPVDRWVGYYSDTVEGELLTHPISAGRRLTLNADVAPAGALRVALVGEWGEEIEGYTLDDAIPVEGDSIAHDVRWNGSAALPGVRGPIRLQIRSSGASVWAFSVHDG